MGPLLTAGQALGALLAVWSFALLLYLLRPRRRRVLVPFMPLWDALLLPEPTTRLFGRLRRIGSLLLALLVTGLIVLALSDPRPRAWTRAPRTRLVLIDAGQHMSARDVAPTRLARACQLAQQLLAAKSAGDRLLIAQFDAGVTPLSALTSEPEALAAALERVTASDAASDIGAALEFAGNVLEGRDGAELVLISDGAFEAYAAGLTKLRERGVELRQLSVGTSRRNVGIRAFAARRYAHDKDQSELLIELENAGPEAEALELTLLSDDVPISVSKLQLAAGERSSRFYGDIPAQARRLEARLALERGPDPLPNDDRAYALLPEKTRTRLLLVTHGNRYLEAALLLDASHDVRAVAPEAYRSADGYDAVVFDAYAPDAPPNVPALYFAPGGDGRAFPFRSQGEIARPYFDNLVPDDPLFRQVALRDVNLKRAQQLQLQPGDRALASSRGTPLIVRGRRAGQPFLAFSFDARESDLPLRVAWPLLIARAIDELHPPDLEFQPPLRVGQEQRVALPGTDTWKSSAGDRARLVEPDGTVQSLPIRAGSIWLRAQRAGFYRVEARGVLQLWAANRDARNSVSIASRRIAAATPLTQAASLWPAVPADAWVALLALVWAVVALEWLSYQRRWTV